MSEEKPKPDLRRLAAQLIEDGSRDFLIVTSRDGSWDFETSNRTWAMGAAARIAAKLDELERIDTRTENGGKP